MQCPWHALSVWCVIIGFCLCNWNAKRLKALLLLPYQQFAFPPKALFEQKCPWSHLVREYYRVKSRKLIHDAHRRADVLKYFVTFFMLMLGYFYWNFYSFEYNWICVKVLNCSFSPTFCQRLERTDILIIFYIEKSSMKNGCLYL